MALALGASGGVLGVVACHEGQVVSGGEGGSTTYTPPGCTGGSTTYTPPGCTGGNELTFEERFDGTLDAWEIDGGAISDSDCPHGSSSCLRLKGKGSSARRQIDGACGGCSDNASAACFGRASLLLRVPDEAADGINVDVIFSVRQAFAQAGIDRQGEEWLPFVGCVPPPPPNESVPCDCPLAQGVEIAIEFGPSPGDFIWFVDGHPVWADTCDLATSGNETDVIELALSEGDTSVEAYFDDIVVTSCCP